MAHSIGKILVSPRRTAERLCVALPISVQVPGDTLSSGELTHTLNCSLDGASFPVCQAYQPETKLRIRFLGKQGLSANACAIPAVVVRSSNQRAGQKSIMAVRFEDADLMSFVLSEQLRAQMRISQALLSVTQALNPEAELQNIIETICDATERALEAERVLLLLFDVAHGVLLPVSQPRDPEIVIRPGEGLLGFAATSDAVTNVNAPLDDPRYRPAMDKFLTANVRSVLCAPLRKERGVSKGLLTVFNKRYGFFSEEDEELVMAISHEVSHVLQEAILFKGVRDMKNYNEAVLESICSGVLTFEKSGKLSTINSAGVRIFDFHPGLDIGKHFTSLFEQETNAPLCMLAGDVLTAQQPRTAHDMRFVHKEGGNSSLNISALPLRNEAGEFLGSVVVAEDITEKHRLMNTLCRYLAREVAEQVLRDREEGRLGGVRTEVTVLIADIRNFTAIAEQMDPMDLMDLLNSYFPRMINVIFRHHGMVDKLMGDAIMAVFGVPGTRDDDALRAVRAALEMRKELSVVNCDLSLRHRTTLEIGIGITSGAVISGNIGSERRMDYTVIGDPVNLAARLEELTKQVDCRILISEKVRGAVEKEFACESLGTFRIKGKLDDIPVFGIRCSE